MLASTIKGENTNSGNHTAQLPCCQPHTPIAAARKPSGMEPESPMNRRISLTLLKDSVVKQKKTSSTAVKNTETQPKPEKSNAKMMIPF